MISMYYATSEILIFLMQHELPVFSVHFVNKSVILPPKQQQQQQMQQQQQQPHNIRCYKKSVWTLFICLA